MIGIYKITSPNNKVYIGQSINIEKRFKSYNKLHCYQQYKLYNSLKKYGYENHIFEIIEECIIEKLNFKERYWQDYYDVLSKNGLNLTLTKTDEKRKVYSQEVIEKIRQSNKKKHIYKSKESLEKSKATQFKKGSVVNNKKVIDTITKQIYDSAKECHRITKSKYSCNHFRDMISGIKTNKTNYKYLNNYMENSEKTMIACYGTLRKGCGNHGHFLKDAEFLGTFKSEPVYSMYTCGGFPGLKEHGNTAIVLEVYAVTEHEAKRVDSLEGYYEDREATFYDKKRIDTPWGNASIYIYVGELPESRLIASGDWINRNLTMV